MFQSGPLTFDLFRVLAFLWPRSGMRTPPSMWRKGSRLTNVRKGLIGCFFDQTQPPRFLNLNLRLRRWRTSSVMFRLLLLFYQRNNEPLLRTPSRTLRWRWWRWCWRWSHADGWVGIGRPDTNTGVMTSQHFADICGCCTFPNISLWPISTQRKCVTCHPWGHASFDTHTLISMHGCSPGLYLTCRATMGGCGWSMAAAALCLCHRRRESRASRRNFLSDKLVLALNSCSDSSSGG